MKCPECEKAGERSRVYFYDGRVTDMLCTPYYDEEGVFHVHDLNIHTDWYSCSRVHTSEERSVVPCPAGDYP